MAAEAITKNLTSGSFSATERRMSQAAEGWGSTQKKNAVKEASI
jgi:hypothetical protein